MPKPWFRVVNLATSAAGEDGASERSARIDIYDQIGEVTDWWTGETVGIAARDFSAALLALGELDAIELHINSPGGSIFDGWQIYNELKRHPARVDVVIDGQAASMASVIAMVGDTIAMPSNATLWVHNPMSTFAAWTTGYSVDMRKIAEDALRTADDLDTYGQALLNAYVDRSGGKVTAEDMRAMMDAETLITAERAVELGLADTIEEPMRAAASYDMAQLMGDQKGRIQAAVEAASRRRQQPPPAVVGMPAKAVVEACREAGFQDLAPDLIAADATEERVRADLAIARDIKDRAAAAGLAARASELVHAALSGGVASALGVVMALKLEQLDPDISNHLPPNPRQGAGGKVIDLKRIWGGRRSAAYR